MPERFALAQKKKGKGEEEAVPDNDDDLLNAALAGAACETVL